MQSIMGDGWSDGEFEVFENGECTVELHYRDGALFVGAGRLESEALIPDGYDRNQIGTIHIGVDGTCVLPEDCSRMFADFGMAESIVFEDADGREVKSTYEMFANCRNAEKIDLSPVPFGSVRDAEGMFSCCGAAAVELPENLGPLESVACMFQDCPELAAVGNLGSLDTSRVGDFDYMFDGCMRLESITGAERWDTSSGKSFCNMFDNCRSLGGMPCGGWDMSSAQSIAGMFYECTSLTQIPVGNWDTGKLENGSYAFAYCTNLETADVSNWDVRNLENANGMFENCMSLRGIDFSEWEPDSLRSAEYLIAFCESLETAKGITALIEKSGIDPEDIMRFCDAEREKLDPAPAAPAEPIPAAQVQRKSR